MSGLMEQKKLEEVKEWDEFYKRMTSIEFYEGDAEYKNAITFEEAKEIIEHHVYFEGFPVLQIASDMAVDCIEKQIPKKTTFSFINQCPVCGFTAEDHLYGSFEYCRHCGQRLEW